MTVSGRRFLVDLAFAGGALALAAGLGAVPPAPPPAPAVPVADEHHPQQICTTGLIDRP